MLKFRVCWLLLVLGGLAACVLAGTKWTLAILLCLLVLPVLSALAMFPVRNKLVLKLETPVNVAKRQTCTVALIVHNPTVVPVAHLKCRLVAENRLTGEQNEITVRTFLLPRQTQRIEVQLDSCWCGRMKITAARTKAYDCFGLIPVPAGCTAAGALTVQPDTFEQTIRVSADANCPDDSEVYSNERPGWDLTETFQIREYQEGDSIRQVHWKLTSKLDKLIIRDPSLPVTRSVMVFWERAGAHTPASADAQAEAVITACRSLVNQSVQFTVAWNDVEQNLCVLQEIRDMDDLIGLMPRLLSAKSSEGAPCGAGLFVQSCGEATFSHILYIAGQRFAEAELLSGLGRVTEQVYGEHFDESTYAEQLMDLEI